MPPRHTQCALPIIANASHMPLAIPALGESWVWRQTEDISVSSLSTTGIPAQRSPLP